jgi:DNA invertase Pin-like site-specific DNA recombinase
VTTTSTDAPRRAVIYARLSKDRHKGKQGEGLSAERQAEDCRALAARLHPPAQVVAVFTDNDISAYKRGGRAKPRPGYDDMLAYLRAGNADLVLAWHTDRLHRDNTELEQFITVCGGDTGIPTYTVQGGDLDLSTSSGRMAARILGAVAVNEIEHMMERQRAAKAETRRLGGRLGGSRPFGYANDIATKDNPGGRGLVPVPAEAAAIRAAAKAIIAAGNGASTYGIAAQWNRAGLRTPVKREGPNAQGNRRGCGGVPWTGPAVKSVLCRAQNAGLIEHDGKVVGKGTWEPILDEDTWRTVRGMLTDPKRRTSPGPHPTYLLTGVLVCAVCGSGRFGVGASRHGHRYYGCKGYANRPGLEIRGGHPQRRQDLLDDYVETIIIARLGRPDARAALNARPAADIPGLNARREAINAELAEWARTPGITPGQLQIVNEPRLAELADIEAQLSEALRGDPLPEFADANGTDKAARIWDGLPIERQRAIAKLLLRVRLHPAGDTRPDGWRIGDPRPFDTDSVEILRPDATPEPDQQARAKYAQQRAALAAREAKLTEIILADPEISDNAAGKAAGTNHKTAGAVRRRLEKAGQIPVRPPRTERAAAQRAKVAEILAGDPAISDGAAARAAGVDQSTTWRVRRELEAAGRIPVLRRRGRGKPVAAA